MLTFHKAKRHRCQSDNINDEDAPIGDQLWWSLAQTFGDMPCSQHLGHISPCFSEWWNTSMFGNIALSGVVSGKREDGVIAKVIQ